MQSSGHARAQMLHATQTTSSAWSSQSSAGAPKKRRSSGGRAEGGSWVGGFGDEDAELAARVLDRLEGLAPGRAQRLRRVAHEGAAGELLDRLLDDAHALAHLLQPDQVALVAVAVAADGDVEGEAVVERVRLDAAHVVGHAARAQEWARHAEGDGALGAERADAAGA